MNKYLLLLSLLMGCTTIPKQELPPLTPTPVEPVVIDPEGPSKQPKYAVGDCLMIVDLPSGETTSPYRVRIEKIEGNVYWYRWLLDDGDWAIDLSCLRNGKRPCSEFESLEKISKKVNDCPP